MSNITLNKNLNFPLPDGTITQTNKAILHDGYFTIQTKL